MNVATMRCACCRRRDALKMLAAAAFAPLAACDSAQKNAGNAPVEIGPATACMLDGMLLADYPGPKGQIHYAGEPEPWFFCDTLEVMNTLLLPEQVRKVNAAYVQDMGKTDWDNPKGAWIAAHDALFVQGSRRKGSMGATLATFGSEADARKFIEEWGGTLLRMHEITPAMLDLRGGTNMDAGM